MSDDQAELRDVLIRNGFVRCDIAACNCGSWHARYGLPERMTEIQDALADAGHPLANENGHIALCALQELVQERDALIHEIGQYRQIAKDKDAMYAEVEAERDELRKDADRLIFACEFDGYSTVSKDRYDFAMDCAEEAGRDEPNDEDELEGLRRLIDAAMAAHPGGER